MFYQKERSMSTQFLILHRVLYLINDYLRFLLFKRETLETEWYSNYRQ